MRVFSGIQPSMLHIGNYFGALSQWIDIQESHTCFYCIVDLHALTSNYPEPISTLSLQTAALYMSCGLDPKKSIIFQQSAVHHHAELFWLLTSKTPLGWLNRMTQFKSNTTKEASSGLHTYPILMAADILLYNADLVPVGEDQKQHLEFARDLAIRCNTLFKQELFTIPRPMIPKSGARIMSLKDGTEKMSKSDPSDTSRITLTDSNDSIALKIRKAKTDSLPLPACASDLDNRPEMHNLYTILSHATNTPLSTLCGSFTSCKAFKETLTDALVTLISPIRTRYQNLIQSRSYLETTLRQGAETAYKTCHDHFKTVASTFLNA